MKKDLLSRHSNWKRKKFRVHQIRAVITIIKKKKRKTKKRKSLAVKNRIEIPLFPFPFYTNSSEIKLTFFLIHVWI